MGKTREMSVRTRDAGKLAEFEWNGCVYVGEEAYGLWGERQQD
jgi:hypothetical protein